VRDRRQQEKRRADEHPAQAQYSVFSRRVVRPA
jgi:hypothetical protein